MSSLINRKCYEKEDLIKVIISFRDENEFQCPTRQDWEEGRISPSLRTFQRKFGNLSQAIIEASKYKSIGDYKNHLFDKEQERILREHMRNKKKVMMKG